METQHKISLDTSDSAIDLIKSEVDIIELQSKIDQAIQESSQIAIFTNESVEEASHYIKNFTRLQKNIDTVRKSYTEPLDQQKKDIMNFFKSLISKFEPEMHRLEDETKAWLKRQKEIAEAKAREERRLAEEKAIADAIEKENRMKQEAEANGENPEDVKVEVAIIPETIVRQPKLSDINSNGISTMKVSKWEIEDETLIPRKYLMVNSALITQVRKAAGAEASSTIPGVRFFFEDTLVRR